ncbi:MAG TPA: alpha/beta fold hydrolase [Gemmatimonadales bacterium]|nr:alpha/beta fold hydrolase [Gemmatimonadales bacterium]
MWLLAVLLIADSIQRVSVPVAPSETLHVEISGAGEPVVLVPTLVGSAFSFRHLVPLLTADGYRTIVIEPLGLGESSRPPHADYSLTAQADRLAAVLDSLGVSSAVIVAHAAAGSEAFRLAYRHPEKVRALVSIEGGPTETEVTASFKRAMRFAPLLRIVGGVGLIRWKMRQTFIASSGDPHWISDSVIRGYTAAAARNLGATLRAFRAVAATTEPVQLAPHLPEIRCPVILMVGGTPHDGHVGPDEIALLRQVLPHFVLDSVPGAGLFLYEEQPAAVVAAVRQASALAASASADP